ncbi:hypothetical protein DFH08DRAFT_710387 [Mycena albidolilacea]|uniref:DUF6589 domain-containing protein n=1 Tax=Mycena albidolilacea TaxID=1033008 RepID=A0AAD6ZKX9_9AGAR|nr:hypothetical protein DFH08DRAFT_710387 [Mycena albidolilacea]
MEFHNIDPSTFYSSPAPRAKSSRAPLQIPATPTPTAQLPTVPPSTQPRLRAPRRTIWDKINDVLGHIHTDFDGLGHFLQILFYIRPHGTKDVRSRRHVAMVTRFLQGQSNVTMGDIIELIYNHRQSQPPPDSEQRQLAFSHGTPPANLLFARTCLSSWALILVAKEARRQIGALTRNDPTDPTDTTQMRASSNGRVNGVVADWDKLADNLSIPKLAAKYARRGGVPWYLTEMMTAPTKAGVVVLRQRRPHTTALGAISSFIFSRNRYATGHLALPLAVWQFACKSHVDEKRIFSRFGFTVHDSTARACLNSLTDTGLTKLRDSVAAGIAVGQMRWHYVLDNVQKFCRQRDLRLGRQDVLKVGCAATAIFLEDCAPGAFDLQDHLDRVMKQGRKEMTTESLYTDIDWDYIHNLTALHWVRILVTFIPQLAHLRKTVELEFNSARMTKRRLPRNRKTVVQPLGTNAERETETQGMMRAMLDFEKQMGLDEPAMEKLIITPRGDGASIAAMWRIKKYLSAHPNHYKAFRNRVPPGPEIWHTRWTQLNSISSNCYGPAASKDPFSLSKSATAAGAKRPTDLKKVDFWPTSRSMTLFFEARVLDCWRIFFKADDIIAHFASGDASLPDLETLWGNARLLVRRYASQEAYHQALSRDFSDSASEEMKIPHGTPWTTPADINPNAPIAETTPDADDLGNGAAEPEKPSVHTEATDFSGDRTLANECLFLQDMGWWVIAAHAVPDGEIGRLWEVMKIWIFCFSGSSNRNYAGYLLETYCLHRYETSQDFSDAMLNNWLINLSGKKYSECDYNQEWFNNWLEELVDHKGGDFDDHFYRHTLAPNVFHFLRFKEHIQDAFELKHRSKTHGAPHLRNEFQQLLRMHKEDELHSFRPGRTLGLAAVNYFGQGYERLEDGRMDQFIEQSTAYSDIMIDVLRPAAPVPDPPTATDNTEELERMVQYAIDNPDLFPEPFADGSDDEDGEVEGMDDTTGDIGIHGLEYSEVPYIRATDDSESESSDEDGEQASEQEEEEMDQDLIMADEDYSTDEEKQ